MVELYLAKVDVAGSNPVSRSIFILYILDPSGSSKGRHSQVAKATVCKTVIPGSNPGAASKLSVDNYTVDNYTPGASNHESCYTNET